MLLPVVPSGRAVVTYLPSNYPGNHWFEKTARWGRPILTFNLCTVFLGSLTAPKLFLSWVFFLHIFLQGQDSTTTVSNSLLARSSWHLDLQIRSGLLAVSSHRCSLLHPVKLRIGETPEDRIERLAVKDVNRRQLKQQELQQASFNRPDELMTECSMQTCFGRKLRTLARSFFKHKALQPEFTKCPRKGWCLR